MAFFTMRQEKLMRRVLVFKDQITDSELHQEPCPLLLAQIEEMQVLTSLLSSNLREFADSMAERVKK